MSHFSDAEKIVYTKCQWLCGCFVIFHSRKDDPFVQSKLDEAQVKPCPCCMKKVFVPRATHPTGLSSSQLVESTNKSNQKRLEKWMKQHGRMD